MANVNVKFRTSSFISKEGTLIFQVSHNNIVRQINTGYKLYSFEWDVLYSSILIQENTDEKRRSYLRYLKEELKKEMDCICSIISQFNSLGVDFTSDQIVEKYMNATKCNSFSNFAKRQILHFSKIGRYSAAEKLKSALNSFICFYGDGNIAFECFDGNMMEEYECFLKDKGLCMNTISFYMRILRSVYNMAVERGCVVQQYPFKYVYTGIDKTVKRAVSIDVIRKIRDLDLSLFPSKEFARDIFMFSFYTRGMSFVDMAFIKKKDLKNGMLIYRRRKTNQQLIIKWEKPMQEIVDKYDTNSGPYLLPIIKNNSIDDRQQYKNALHLVNNKLKEIGEEIGVEVVLTTYVARHCWASIAQNQNIPMDTISKALGHDSEKTTRIYLASLDTSSVDKANDIIINSL